jgi:hypothetical protein
MLARVGIFFLLAVAFDALMTKPMLLICCFCDKICANSLDLSRQSAWDDLHVAAMTVFEVIHTPSLSEKDRVRQAHP